MPLSRGPRRLLDRQQTCYERVHLRKTPKCEWGSAAILGLLLLIPMLASVLLAVLSVCEIMGRELVLTAAQLMPFCLRGILDTFCSADTLKTTKMVRVVMLGPFAPLWISFSRLQARWTMLYENFVAEGSSRTLNGSQQLFCIEARQYGPVSDWTSSVSVISRVFMCATQLWAVRKQAISRSVLAPDAGPSSLTSDPEMDVDGEDSSRRRFEDAPHTLAAVRGSLLHTLEQLKNGPAAEDTWVDSETGVVDWGSSLMDVDMTMHDSLDVRTMALLASKLEEFLNEETRDVGSDDEEAERSDAESSTDAETPLPFLPGRKTRKVNASAEKSEWYPWPDKETCVLDVLRHIPRCSFSKKQNAAIHWAMLALGLKDLPSDRVMDDIDKALQPLCGIQSIRYAGKLGHVYYTNDFAGIIAQEMANPSVRKHLQFLPEDNGSKLAEAWQAKRWLDELDSDLATPMHRIGSQDFYVHEPAILQSGDTCIPTRWFERDGQVFARVWRMQQVADHNGWVVDISQTYELSAAQFLVAFPAFIATHNQRNLADPRLINGVYSAPNTELSPWTYTNSLHGNRWRSQANGHRVVAFPVWLYCDDTSGNQSKKWNKHNSFLFTAAGLPRRLVHLESNIHFLATSNIAPPLEMLDGIVDQLCSAQARGIWAWDSILNEIVLVIPRITQFMKRGLARNREYTCNELKSQFAAATIVGGKTDYKSAKTSSGVKDTYMEVFVEKIFAISTKKKIPKPQKQAMVNALCATLPAELTSPVWRIKDLDPTQDTPVEILHVILLGFVKYFWRDAIARLKAPEKAILSTRLSSFDVSGLGISPLSGHTLVDYSGSLTGRDFRAIAQAAPFVLHGLLETERVQAWAALGAVVSLVWQPEIREPRLLHSDFGRQLTRLDHNHTDQFLEGPLHTRQEQGYKPKFPNNSSSNVDAPGWQPSSPTIPSSDDTVLLPGSNGSHFDRHNVTTFLDAIANEKGLSNEHRFDLHVFHTLGVDLKMDYILASLMKQQSLYDEMNKQNRQLQEVLDKVIAGAWGKHWSHGRPERHVIFFFFLCFVLICLRETDLTAFAKQLIVDPKRTTYDNDSVIGELEARLFPPRLALSV
ncbi:hypothetical protein HMN09_00396400 [Mycena chlorophos]|uniref:Uncharacterized protein n=1 Tax=Mycena chlorophos TaxID=658473 RepID=A0A8H6WIZ4_MYCCL|nr:hypothetical protein HMN09_00396400 [Mycena chlorophos]